MGVEDGREEVMGVAVLWAAVAAARCAVGFLLRFVAALSGDLVFYPRGRCGTRRRPVRAQA